MEESDRECAHCRNHGICVHVNLEEHKRLCIFRDCCLCFQCLLVTEREALRRYKEKLRDKCVQTVSYWYIDEYQGCLSSDFCNLLDTGLNHDVELKCGEQSVKAHKIVLCAQSEVFKAMLEGDMQEGRTGVVEMQDIDVNNLRHFAPYLYTDELPELTFDQAGILYETGDKYAIKSLMHRCVEYLQKNLSSENISQCHSLAEAHSDQYLMDLMNIVKYNLENKLILHRDFWSPLSENSLGLANDVHRLFQLQSIGRKEDKTTQTVSLWNAVGSSGSMFKDFSNLLDTDVNHDVEIKCGDHAIKVHKIVLCARSEVFKVLLHNDMLQSRIKQLLEIPDIYVCYLQYFVRYLYTDMLPELTFDKARMLRQMGYMYCIRSLIHRCSKYFKDNPPAKITSKYIDMYVEHSDQNLEDRITTYDVNQCLPTAL